MNYSSVPYQRDRAIAYAHRWAYKRNPAYADFEEMGGDCTNFVSQCLYAGGGIMNTTPVHGWYYKSLKQRAPAWSGVNELYRFLTNNHAAGPVGKEVSLENVLPGDIIQLATEHSYFHHGMIVVDSGRIPALDNILIACHSYDADNRPLSSYHILNLRCIHITHVNL